MLTSIYPPEITHLGVFPLGVTSTAASKKLENPLPINSHGYIKKHQINFFLINIVSGPNKLLHDFSGSFRKAWQIARGAVSAIPTFPKT